MQLERRSGHEIQDRNTSENHLAQIINYVGQLGYLHTQRRRNGGVMQGRPMGEIRFGDVFRALESQVPIAECFADVDNTGTLVEACRLRITIADAAEAFTHIWTISRWMRWSAAMNGCPKSCILWSVAAEPPDFVVRYLIHVRKRPLVVMKQLV